MDIRLCSGVFAAVLVNEQKSPRANLARRGLYVIPILVYTPLRFEQRRDVAPYFTLETDTAIRFHSRLAVMDRKPRVLRQKVGKDSKPKVNRTPTE
jgi:hypothetical protein